MKTSPVEVTIIVTILGLLGLAAYRELPEENDYALTCYSGGKRIYEKTSPDYLDIVALTPQHVVIEDDDGTTNILNASCVWKEP